MKIRTDEYYIRKALQEAQKALKKGEVPVGAVVVKKGKIIGEGYNQSIHKNDPTAHAEIVAIKKACLELKNYRLNDCILYVTLEPCPMCASALVHARIKRIVFSAKDPKTGACGSVFNIARNRNLNHQISITSGILQNKCETIIKNFFKQKRTSIFKGKLS